MLNKRVTSFNLNGKLVYESKANCFLDFDSKSTFGLISISVEMSPSKNVTSAALNRCNFKFNSNTPWIGIILKPCASLRVAQTDISGAPDVTLNLKHS